MATTTTPMPTTTPDPGATLPPDPGIMPLAASPVNPPLQVPAGARKATHFPGPVTSGAGADYVKGAVPLYYRFDIDKSTGNFSNQQLKFPVGTIFWRLISLVQVAFDGTTPKLNIGTTPGGSDVGSIAISATAAVENNVLSTVLPASGILYVSLTGGPFTVGHASVVLAYFGAPAAPWT